MGRMYKHIASTKVFDTDRFPKRSASRIEESILQARARIRRYQLIGWIKTIATVGLISLILYWSL